MDTNLLTIDNVLFAATTLAPSTATKPPSFLNSPKSTQTTYTTNPSSNATEPKKTDNIYNIEKDDSISKAEQDFNHTLSKAVKNESPGKNQANSNNANKNELNKNQGEQNLTSEALPKTETVQSEPTQVVPFTLELLVKENTTKIEPKTNNQLAQLIAKMKDGTSQKDSKSHPTAEKANKTAETIIPTTTQKEKIVPETVITNSSENQKKLQTVLPNISNDTPVSDKKTTNNQDNNTTPVLNESIVNNKILDHKQLTKETASDALVDANSNKTANNEKIPILETSIVTDKTQSLKPINKQLDTEAIKVDASKTINENSTLTDKPVAQTNENTTASNTSFSDIQTQNKIIEQNSQSDATIPEKSISNNNKAPLNESDSKITDQKILSESSKNENKETTNSENKLSDKDTTRELNILDVQVATNQTKHNNSTTFKNNPDSEFEQIITQNHSQPSVTEQPSGSTAGAKPLDIPAQTSPGNPNTDAAKQVFESIHSSFSQEQRNQQITVQLNPPELGKVSIKFQEQDEQITGLVEVSKTQTRVEIEQAIPQIVRSLQESGIQIKRLDIVLTQEQNEQPGQEALKDQTMQNGFTKQQQGSADSYAQSNNPEADEINKWLINNNNRYRNISELQEFFSANDSINMLV